MRYIDQEKIYDATDQGLTIFEHYFPGIDLKSPKTFFKVRDGEKTASARVAWYQGYWRITDFGQQDTINGMKAIDFVVWREALPYYDALLFIEQCIINRQVDGKDFVKSKWTADYEKREVGPSDKKGEYNFTFKEHPTKDDLAAIGRYVTEDILDKYNCKCVEKYEFCGKSSTENKDIVHIFKANKDYPIFVFDYGDFKKLYKPHEQNKKYRFQYIGKKPADYIYGLKQLEKEKSEFTDDDEEGGVITPEDKPEAKVVDLFRCSGESDALNLAALGFHVYWLNSESADFDFKTFKKLDDLCENHYQVMDLDTTGQEQAMKNAMKHISLFTIELPKWLKTKRDFRGNPCKDLKDFLNLSGEDRDQTRYDFLILKRAARRVKFWNKNKDKNGGYNYSINMEYFFFFLRANGFYQMESIYHKKAGYCYARITGKIVELIHPDDIKRIIKRFTKDWIKSKKLMDAIEILNKINTSNQLTEANIESIDMIDLCFKNHSRDTEFIHFKNGSLRVKHDKIEKVHHSEVPNHILGQLTINNKKIAHLIDNIDIRAIEKPAVEVEASLVYSQLLEKLKNATSDDEREFLNHEIAQLPDTDKYTLKINDSDFIFVKFIRDLARLHWRKESEQKIELTDQERKEEALSFINLMFVLGYHCAQYKDPGKPWLTFLQDSRIGEIGTASGRSGKSVLSKAPTYVRASFYKGGRMLNDKNQYQFFYDGLTEFHDYIEIDDLHEFADFGFFYTQVTGKREVNPKNYTAFVLDYEDSGKMLISSNYQLQNVDSSTIGRLLNAQVSDYYHEKTKYNDYKETRSPLTKYGRRMYDDFTDEEWVKFYNFIAYCIQLQMRFHKIQPPMGNIEKQQLRRAMAQGLGKDEEFFRWANDYFINKPAGYNSEFSVEDYGYFNTLIFKEKPFDAFLEKLTQKQRHDYKPGKFKKHLEAWCEYHGYEFNPESVCTDTANRRILKTIDGKTRELIYISTAKSNRPPAAEIQYVNSDEPLPF